jgi:hypothetical protein
MSNTRQTPTKTIKGQRLDRILAEGFMSCAQVYSDVFNLIDPMSGVNR